MWVQSRLEVNADLCDFWHDFRHSVLKQQSAKQRAVCWWLQDRNPSHVWSQNVRNNNRPILLLIIFKNGNYQTWHGSSCGIEGVAECCGAASLGLLFRRLCSIAGVWPRIGSISYAQPPALVVGAAEGGTDNQHSPWPTSSDKHTGGLKQPFDTFNTSPGQSSVWSNVGKQTAVWPEMSQRWAGQVEALTRRPVGRWQDRRWRSACLRILDWQAQL